jgi:hypothetical protein
LENFPSDEKSRSTANMTGRKQKEFMLDDSEEDEKPHRGEDSINVHPLDPTYHRNYREE